MTEYFIPVPPKLTDAFIGVPVLLQLKHVLVVPEVVEAQALPHATQTTRQWIPTESHLEDKSPAGAEFIRYAVIVCFDEYLAKVQWLVPSTSGPVVVESLFPVADIAAVTRIVNQPPLPEEPKLIKI